jgi:ADP-ribosylation factor protein 1
VVSIQLVCVFFFLIKCFVYIYSHSGKTTILHVIKHGEVVATTPTIGTDFEKLLIDNITMIAVEAGGRSVIRPLRRNYYQNSKAFIFVVDSNDRDRIDEARKELHQMTNEDELKYKPVLIFANKQDLPNAMTLDELGDKLALAELGENTKWHLQAASAVQNEGLKEGFEWLANTLVPKTDFIKPIVETLNDSTRMKNSLLSVLSLVNLKDFLNKFVHF